MTFKYWQSNLPFRHPFTISRGTKTHQPAFVIELSHHGIKGYGEAPAISYYDISVEKMIEDIEAKRKLVESFSFTTPDRFWHYCHHLFPGNSFLVCALDINGEYYPLNNFSFIISENGNSLKSLLGILNSRLMNWYFSNCFVDYNIKPKYLEQLPLPTNTNSSDLDALISEIILLKSKDKDSDTKDLENKIDNAVYKLYDLTEEEIKIVEQNSN